MFLRSLLAIYLHSRKVATDRRQHIVFRVILSTEITNQHYVFDEYEKNLTSTVLGLLVVCYLLF